MPGMQSVTTISRTRVRVGVVGALLAWALFGVGSSVCRLAAQTQTAAPASKTAELATTFERRLEAIASGVDGSVGYAVVDLTSGQVQLMFCSYATMAGLLKDGKLIAHAVMMPARSSVMPDVPTMAESGVSGFSEAGSDLWFGIVGPAKIPRPIVMKLNETLIAAMRSPDMRERASAAGFELWTSSPEEFAEVIRVDRTKWTRIVAASGAKLE